MLHGKWVMKFSSLLLTLVFITACGTMDNDNDPPADQDINNQKELEENNPLDINEENMNNHRNDLNQPNDWNDEKLNNERNKQLVPNNRNMNDQR